MNPNHNMDFSYILLTVAYWSTLKELFKMAKNNADAMADDENCATKTMCWVAYDGNGSTETICRILVNLVQDIGGPFPAIVNQVIMMNEIRCEMDTCFNSEQKMLQLVERLTILKCVFGQNITNFDSILCKIRANAEAYFLRLPSCEMTADQCDDKMKSLENNFLHGLDLEMKNADGSQQLHFVFAASDISIHTQAILAFKRKGADQNTLEAHFSRLQTFNQSTLRAEVCEILHEICENAFQHMCPMLALHSSPSKTGARTAASTTAAGLFGSTAIPAEASLVGPTTTTTTVASPTAQSLLVVGPTAAASLASPDATPTIYRHAREESFSPQETQAIREWVLVERAVARIHNQPQVSYKWENLMKKSSRPLGLFQRTNVTQLKDKARNLFKPHDIFDLYDMLPGEQNQA